MINIRRFDRPAKGEHTNLAYTCTISQLLLEAGAPLELKNKIGTSPLWLACGYGHLSTAKLLLQHKANPDAQNFTGRGCL